MPSSSSGAHNTYCARVLTLHQSASLPPRSRRHHQIFNLQNPQQVFKKLVSPLKYQTRCVTAFPDRTGYLVGSIEGRVAVQHVDDAQSSKNFTFKCHREGQDIYAVNACIFHPTQGTFVTTGADGCYNFWDKDSKQRLKAREEDLSIRKTSRASYCPASSALSGSSCFISVCCRERIAVTVHRVVTELETPLSPHAGDGAVFGADPLRRLQRRREHLRVRRVLRLEQGGGGAPAGERAEQHLPPRDKREFVSYFLTDSFCPLCSCASFLGSKRGARGVCLRSGNVKR